MLKHGVQETTSTAGTGTLTLSLYPGFSRFLERYAIGAPAPYEIENGVNKEWGIGTVGAGNTLARTTITGTLTAAGYISGGTALTLVGVSTVTCVEHEASGWEAFFAVADPLPVYTTPARAAANATTLVANFAALPVIGISNVVYVAIDTGRAYRWTGSGYVGFGFPLDANGNLIASVNLRTGLLANLLTLGGGFGEIGVNAYSNSFTASISVSTMTVTAVTTPTLAVGQLISGGGIAAGTTILSLLTGSGGLGTYVVSGSQTLASTVFTAITQPNAIVLYNGIPNEAVPFYRSQISAYAQSKATFTFPDTAVNTIVSGFQSAVLNEGNTLNTSDGTITIPVNAKLMELGFSVSWPDAAVVTSNLRRIFIENETSANVWADYGVDNTIMSVALHKTFQVLNTPALNVIGIVGTRIRISVRQESGGSLAIFPTLSVKFWS